MKRKKNGLTLVELMAVLIVLAIILAILIPSILNIGYDSKVATMKTTAKLIADRGETQYFDNQNFNVNEEITCASLVDLTSDYGNCNITFNSDGVATIKLNGAEGSKFDGLYCTGTKSNMFCGEGSYTN